MTVTTAIAATALVLTSVAAGGPRPQPAAFVLVYAGTMPGVTAPVVREQTQPSYPAQAFRDGLQGMVSVDVTVGTDGHVRDAMVTQSAGPELDGAVIASVSKWFFTPGRLNGVEVPVRVSITNSFTTR
jgi:TonB family protein